MGTRSLTYFKFLRVLNILKVIDCYYGLKETGVGGYVFGVTGEGCGCVSMNVSGDTTIVTCSGWTAAGQTCSFEVRTLSRLWVHQCSYG